MKRRIFAFLLVLLLSTCFAFAKVTPILSVQPRFSYNNYPLLPTTAGSLRQNQLAGWYERYQDYYRAYYSEKGLLDIGLKIEDEHFGLVFDIDARNALDEYFEKNSNSNIPFLLNSIHAVTDLNFPRVGFVEAKFDNFYASFGRRQIKWGPASYDMAISDSAPFLDNLWLNYSTPAGSGSFWYNFIAVSLNSAVLGDTANTGLKNMFAHKIGWESNSFRISAGELNLVYGEMPNLLDITPLGIWHNLYQDKKSNVMMTIDIEGLIKTENFGSLRLYGSFTMDDFDLPAEIANPNGKPAAMGFNGGFQYHILDSEPFVTSDYDFNDYKLEENTFEFKDGLNLSYEIYFATPYLYNRAVDTGKYTVAMRTFTFGHGYVDDENAFFIGFPYGPNSLLHIVEVSYTTTAWTAWLSGEYLTRGSYGIDSPYGAADIDPNYMDYRFKLRGDLTRVIIINAGGIYNVSNGIDVSLDVNGSFDITNNKKAFNASIGASIAVQELGK